MTETLDPKTLLHSFREELAAEFPTFEIKYKRGDRLQEAIDIALKIVTFGAQRVYLTRYHTVMFGRLYVPGSWDTMSAADKYILLRHERIHLRQRRRMGDIAMAFVYLVPFFPLGLAYGRARIEWEAYIETIRATFELYGIDRARAIRPEIVRRFVSGDYGWMWPFPSIVGRWFDDEIARLPAPP